MTPASSPAVRRRGLLFLAGGAAVLAAGLVWQGPSLHAAEVAVALPAPVQDVPADGPRLQKAVFAGGCFWGVQGVFQHVKGVQRAVSGYSGGSAATASYDAVSSGRTAHAEAVEVTFDPTQVSYGALLQIFFSVAHDPTQLNRQGPDRGTQYRSAIFTQDPAQVKVAQAYIAQLDAARAFGAPIVTRVEPGPGFYPAETYHQDYLTENPRAPYIVVHDLPKLDNLKKMFPQRWRQEPVLVKRS
jgi:peptide-methionine (S)-S-oxide reductase